MYAVMGDSLEVTNYLAVSGADLTIVDNVSWTHTPHTDTHTAHTHTAHTHTAHTHCTHTHRRTVL